MDILETIAVWKLQNLHLLVTSRRERDIESSLECFVDRQHTISLQSELVDKDIQRYVQQRLSDDKSLRKWQKDPAIRQEIENTLTKGACGMFRWAVCQLDTLGKCRNRLTLRKSLATLPPTLDETYERILCAINKEDTEYAVRILRWLTFSSRPLLVEEISEVVAIDVERVPVFDREEVLEDPLEVLSICSSLINIATTEESTPRAGNGSSESTRLVVVLAHYSVKEYLISKRIQQGRAVRYSMQDVACNEVIAKSCLEYILQFQQSDSFSGESIEEFKLAKYSAEFWITHAQAALDHSEALSRLILKLFLTRNGAYINWIRIHDPEKPWQESNFRKVLETVPAPLYYASQAGLSKVVSLLLLE
ncbi:hypothetical protein K469DRAFT_599451, partial [Zopfia rhizophila CBS 207.26]